MHKRYYFDTSIWLDVFENRNEINLPKEKYTRKLIEKIIKDNDKIIISETIKNEMIGLGYFKGEIETLFFPFKKILIVVYSTKEQFKRAKSLSKKRNVPLFDVLHSLISKDQESIMVTRDQHFVKLSDITISKKPEEII